MPSTLTATIPRRDLPTDTHTSIRDRKVKTSPLPTNSPNPEIRNPPSRIPPQRRPILASSKPPLSPLSTTRTRNQLTYRNQRTPGNHNHPNSRKQRTLSSLLAIKLPIHRPIVGHLSIPASSPQMGVLDGVGHQRMGCEGWIEGWVLRFAKDAGDADCLCMWWCKVGFVDGRCCCWCWWISGCLVD